MESGIAGAVDLSFNLTGVVGLSLTLILAIESRKELIVVDWSFNFVGLEVVDSSFCLTGAGVVVSSSVCLFRTDPQETVRHKVRIRNNFISN